MAGWPGAGCSYRRGVWVSLSGLAFCAGGAAAADSYWIGAADGDWDDPSRWSAGVPGAGDRAIVDATGAVFVIHADLFGEYTLGELIVDSDDATVRFDDRCELDVEGVADLRRGAVEFIGYAGPSGNGIIGGVWVVSPSSTLLVQDATIRGATVVGEVDTARDFSIWADAQILGGIRGTRNFRIGLGDGEERVIDFDLDGEYGLEVDTPFNGFDVLPSLVFGPGTTARFGEYGEVTRYSSGSARIDFRNEGVIVLDGTGRDSSNGRFDVERFVNTGLVLVDRGADVSFGQGFRNEGSVLVLDGAIQIKPESPADLGDLDNRGLVRINGIDATGDELVLDQPGSDWVLNFDIRGGTLRVADDVGFLSTARFADIVIDASPDLLTRAPGVTTLGEGVAWLNGPIDFDGELVLAGPHSIPAIVGGEAARKITLMPGYSLGADISLGKDPATIQLQGGAYTIEPSVTLSGQGLTIRGAGMLLNEGTIVAGSGQRLSLFLQSLTTINRGVIEVKDGGWIGVTSSRLVNEGVIRIDADSAINWTTNGGEPVTAAELAGIENAGSLTLSAPINLTGVPSFTIDEGFWALRTVTGGGEVRIGPGAELQAIGDSSVEGSVDCEGTLRVARRDELLIVGDLELGPDSTLAVGIQDAADPDEYSTITVTGSASLDGRLLVDATFLGGTHTEFGSAMILHVDGQITGDFAEIELISVSPMRASFDPSTGVLTVNRGCAPADLGEPFGQIDLADIVAFVTGFQGKDTVADLNGDGLWDVADISIFAGSFVGGCP